MNLMNGITWLMLVFFAIGAVDFLLDNKIGLGREFENGIMASGRLLVCMSGFMVLSPRIARSIEPAAAPFFRSFGADPSIIAGMLLANDAGGAALAMELADTKQAGLFGGMIVGAMLGTTVMLNIPILMSIATKKERPSVIYGILCGIITIPAGCLAGGLAAGFDTQMILFNTLPVLALSLIFLVLLLLLKEKIFSIFFILGKLLSAVSMLGLCCGAVEFLTGFRIIKGAGSLEEVFPVVGGIALFLAGAFPLLAAVRMVFFRFMDKAGRFLGISGTDVSALLLSLANSLPAIMMIHDMDDRGRILNVAFLASAGCVLGDHLAFTSQVAPELCGPVVIGKLTGGILALTMALILSSKLSKETFPYAENDG